MLIARYQMVDKLPDTGCCKEKNKISTKEMYVAAAMTWNQSGSYYFINIIINLKKKFPKFFPLLSRTPPGPNNN